MYLGDLGQETLCDSLIKAIGRTSSRSAPQNASVSGYFAAADGSFGRQLSIKLIVENFLFVSFIIFLGDRLADDVHGGYISGTLESALRPSKGCKDDYIRRTSTTTRRSELQIHCRR